jgi:hypothetical protein
MKNIAEIKQGLIVFRDTKKIDFLLPEAVEKRTKEEIAEASVVFINKLIKHLDSKNPSKSTISGLIMKSFIKLQHAGANEDFLKYFSEVASGIISHNFEGAFPSRLNVKSKEFFDLEDWGPSRE